MNASDDCIFCKIVRGDLPGDIVYEDERALAFRDIHPAAPVHVLVIPRTHVETVVDLVDAAADDGFLASVVACARELGLDSFRMVVNNGAESGQVVPHLHVHLLSGRNLKWPPG